MTNPFQDRRTVVSGEKVSRFFGGLAAVLKVDFAGA